jgi:hypothetical protein
MTKETGQAMKYKTLYRIPNIEHRESHLKPGVTSGTLEGLAVSAPHVSPVVVLLLQTRLKAINGERIDYD